LARTARRGYYGRMHAAGRMETTGGLFGCTSASPGGFQNSGPRRAPDSALIPTATLLDSDGDGACPARRAVPRDRSGSSVAALYRRATCVGMRFATGGAGSIGPRGAVHVSGSPLPARPRPCAGCTARRLAPLHAWPAERDGVVSLTPRWLVAGRWFAPQPPTPPAVACVLRF